VADYDAVILPGEEGKIKVVIKGYKIQPGKNKKSFTVTSNDQENRKAKLTVAANVKKVFEVSKRLYFTGFIDDPLELEAEVTNLIDEPIRIVDYYWSNASRDREKYIDKLNVTIDEIETGKKYALLIKRIDEIEPGRYMGTLALKTNSLKLKEKKVHVVLTINAAVNASPKVLLCGEMKIGKGEEGIYEKRFKITTMRGDSLKVLKVIPSRDDIEVDIEELQPGRIYQGTATIRPTKSERKYQASIKIYTNYRGGEELEVTLRGKVVDTDSKK
jgi:hypothetical protein